MIKFLLELFVLYIVYKFIFELILPVYHTTKQIKRKMEDAQQQMRQNQSASSSNKSNFRTEAKNKSDNNDDYIDFEEVK